MMLDLQEEFLGIKKQIGTCHCLEMFRTWDDPTSLGQVSHWSLRGLPH